jgi:hypothetical protein
MARSTHSPAMMVEAGYPPGLRRGTVKASSSLANNHHTISPELELRPPSNCMAFNCGAPNGPLWLHPKGETHLPNVADGLLATEGARKGNPRPANRTRASAINLASTSVVKALQLSIVSIRHSADCSPTICRSGDQVPPRRRPFVLR